MAGKESGKVMTTEMMQPRTYHAYFAVWGWWIEKDYPTKQQARTAAINFVTAGKGRVAQVIGRVVGSDAEVIEMRVASDRKKGFIYQ